MTLIETLWQQIRKEASESRIQEGEFRLVRINQQHPFEFYAGLDGAGSILFAVSISVRPPSIDADIGALNYVRTKRAGGNWIMALRLTSPDLEPVFGRLCQDLIGEAEIVATEAALILLFRDRLLLWMRLFRDGGSGLLQNFQIKGLIAELLALEGFIECTDDPSPAVVSWVGPSGADQDFLFNDRAFEIKAVSPNAEKVSISSAHQLHANLPLELRLYVLRDSTPSEDFSISLSTLTSRIEQRLSGWPSALHAFRSKLVQAGYVENDHYQSVAFTLMEIRRYFVSNKFPKLVRPGLPDAIADVSYNLLLSSITPFLISEN